MLFCEKARFYDKYRQGNEKKLESIGINSAEDLTRVGSTEAFFRLKMRYSNLCLVHLYALQGAVDGVEHSQLSPEVKHNLKNFNESME